MGWNQVANPFAFDVDWKHVLVDDNGYITGHRPWLIDDAAYWFSGLGYLSVNTLLAWDGFFLFVKRENLKLLFPYRERSRDEPVMKPAPLGFDAPRAEWLLRLDMTADDYLDDGNFAGVHARASKGPDDFDLAEPPPPPGGSPLAFRLPEDDRYLRRTDIRPPFESGAEWNLILASAEKRTITVTGIETLPENMEAYLILDIGTSISLDEGTRIDLPPDVNAARLVVGDRLFTESEVASVLPEDYFLSQNFPNPFNNTTSLRFFLPVPTSVLLEVYNLLGQRVVTLVEGETAAGIHTVVWDGFDANGRPVATGVYFYRLTAGEFEDVRKMVLLK
jgi:hypothetical protein